MPSHIAAVVALALAFLVAGGQGYAATLVVTKTADTADGVCDGDCSLREAVIAAAGGDTIVFSALFNSPQTITLTNGQMSIAKNLAITGTGRDLVTVSGNQAGRIFEISQSAVVTLSGMTLRNGRVETGNTPSGGAIHITDSELTLLNMAISNNRAYRFTVQPFMEFGLGGGIYAVNSSLMIAGTTVRDNYSYNGGGISVTVGPLTLIDSVVELNRGGGVSGNQIAQTIVDNSIINGNQAVSTPPGGNARWGLNIHGGDLLISNSAISENVGTGILTSGRLLLESSIVSNNLIGLGGVWSVGPTTISGSTIDGNQGISEGGGVTGRGMLDISDSTISNNRSVQLGGGIYFFGFGRATITNSTISGNRIQGSNPPDCLAGGIFVDSNVEVVLTNSTVTKNNSPGKGSGIGRRATATTIKLRNSIVADNTAGAFPDVDISGAVVSEGHNLIGNTTGSSGWLATDLLNRNAALGPLANNGGPTMTHALLPNSQAVNSGSDALAVDPVSGEPLTGDQRGSPRFVGTVDIGAFESNFTVTYVMFAGRVTTANGRGVEKAVVTLTNGQETIYAFTNPFGYYRFVNLLSGSSYTIAVSDKRYEFGPPQPITLTTNPPDINFIGQ